MSKVIGKDVTVYTWQLAGTDVAPATGATSNILGRWESVEVTLTNEWANVTSSDAFQPEKRLKLDTWTASLKGWIDDGGSQAIEAFLAAKLVIVTFKEKNSNKTMILRGGISKTTLTISMDHGKDSMELEDVGSGYFGGAATMSYA